MMHEVIVRGGRGSISVCAEEFLRYGGLTTCLTIRLDAGLIIIDAGTAISHVDAELRKRATTPPMALLLTHLHIDHLIGLPCFAPIYQADGNITIQADRRRGPWKQHLRTLMGKPFWPIGLSEGAAATTCRDLPTGDRMELYGATVSWCNVPHPQQCLAFRIAGPRGDVVLATDAEFGGVQDAQPLIELARGAEFLICDAHYTPEEYECHRGWGHSSWETAARIAEAAKVGQLILTHHAPLRTDREIDAIVDAARGVFANTVASTENMVLIGS